MYLTLTCEATGASVTCNNVSRKTAREMINLLSDVFETRTYETQLPGLAGAEVIIIRKKENN